MKINGYWLGAGLISLLDYIYLLFIATDEGFFSLSCGLTMIGLVVFFGLAFRKDDVVHAVSETEVKE